MTDDIYIYLVDLPYRITEMVCPCCGGYTIYLNSRMDRETQKKGYLHAMGHIENNDFEKEDVQIIEDTAHKIRSR